MFVSRRKNYNEKRTGDKKRVRSQTEKEKIKYGHRNTAMSPGRPGAMAKSATYIYTAVPVTDSKLTGNTLVACRARRSTARLFWFTCFSGRRHAHPSATCSLAIVVRVFTRPCVFVRTRRVFFFFYFFRSSFSQRLGYDKFPVHPATALL